MKHTFGLVFLVLVVVLCFGFYARTAAVRAKELAPTATEEKMVLPGLKSVRDLSALAVAVSHMQDEDSS